LDPTFGSGGHKTFDVAGLKDDIATGVALDSQGRIVLGGYASNGTDYDFALARFNPQNGSIDSSFGTNNQGYTRTDIAGKDDYANALVIDSTGRIILAGSALVDSDYDFALQGYTPNG